MPETQALPRNPSSVECTLRIMQMCCPKCFDFQIDALTRRAFGTGSDLQDVVHQKVWQRERLKAQVVVGVTEPAERGKAPRVCAHVEKAPASPNPSRELAYLELRKRWIELKIRRRDFSHRLDCLDLFEAEPAQPVYDERIRRTNYLASTRDAI